MKKILACVLAMTALILPSMAGEIDPLLDKLVEKEIITPIEAKMLLEDARHQVKEEMANMVHPTLPKWLQAMKFGGDFRLRYQHTDTDGAANVDRARYRLRLGVSAKVSSDFSAYFGLATGSGDPRSTNRTMEDTFAPGIAYVDYAYAEYSAFPFLTFFGGKFKLKNALYAPSDFLWDSDTNPDGLAFASFYNFSGDLTATLNGGYLILDELSGSATDPYMGYVQAVLEYTSGRFYVKPALTAYMFGNLKGKTLYKSGGTNTLSGGKLAYDYDAISPAIEFGFVEPEAPFLRFANVFAEYIYSYDPETANEGFVLGLTLGDAKPGKQGAWQVAYMYKRTERDAWPDAFPDSDFYGGKTDTAGHELILQRGIRDNVWLSFDCYRTENLTGAKVKENLFQWDVNVKFGG